MRRSAVLSAAVAAVLSGATGAEGEPIAFTKGTGTYDWSVATNWTPAKVPVAGDVVSITPPTSTTGDVVLELGGLVQELSQLNFTINTNNRVQIRNGTLRLSSISQTGDDANEILGTVNVEASTPDLTLNSTSNTLAVQGKITTTGNLIKNGTSRVRLGTSGTAFTSAIAGNIVINTGTLEAAVDGSGANATNNVLGGTGTEILLNAGELALRSRENFDFVRNLQVLGNSTVSVDQSVTGFSNKTLRLGNLSIGANTLTVNGGNGYALRFNDATLTGQSTFNVNSAGMTVAGISGTAGFIKTGAQSLTITGDNSTTLSGPTFLRGGLTRFTSVGGAGSGPITVGDDTNAGAGAVEYILGGTTNNTAAADVTVNFASQVNIVGTPTANDTFVVNAFGVLQGSSAELAALTPGGNLTIAENAIIGHESNNSADPVGIAAITTPTYHFGVSGNLSQNITVGAGTPWKAVVGDRESRTLSSSGAGATPLQIKYNDGGDDDAETIDANIIVLGANAGGGKYLSLGNTAATEGGYTFVSGNGKKMTLAVTGMGGTLSVAGAGVAGGNLRLDESNPDLSALDRIVVQSGTLIANAANALSQNVPVVVQSGGGLDLGNAGAINGPVLLKSGSVIYLNDNFGLNGSGTITQEAGVINRLASQVGVLVPASGTQQSLGTVAGSIVRLEVSDINDLDNQIHDGVTYVVTGGDRTQKTGITLNGGVLTNDASGRTYNNSGAAGAVNTIRIVGAGATIASTTGQNFTINPLFDAAGTALTFGSTTPIDGQPKAGQVLVRNTLNAASANVVAGNLILDGQSQTTPGNSNINFTGDLTVSGTNSVLYLGAGGSSNGQGNLSPRLTDTSGTAANRVADRIVLGATGRIEMGLDYRTPAAASGRVEVTQPFVLTGDFNPLDRRSFYVSRRNGGTTALAVTLNNVTMRDGSMIGIHQDNTNVRASVTLEPGATVGASGDKSQWDWQNILGSGVVNQGRLVDVAGLNNNVWGTIATGISLNLVRGQVTFRDGAVLDGSVRSHTAVGADDSSIRILAGANGTSGFLTGSGRIELGRSQAQGGTAEELVALANDGTLAGGQIVNTIPTRIDVLDDGTAAQDAVLRTAVNGTDTTQNGRVLFSNVHTRPGVYLQLHETARTDMELSLFPEGDLRLVTGSTAGTIYVNKVVDESSQGATVRLTGGNANPIKFTGPVNAKKLVVGGAEGAGRAVLQSGAALNVAEPVELGTGGVLDVTTATSAGLDLRGGTLNVTALLTIPAGKALSGTSDGTAGDINVGAGGSLLLADAAVLSPGLSALGTGLLTIDGDLSLSPESILRFTLGRTDASDTVKLNNPNAGTGPGGNLVLDGLLEVEQTPEFAGGTFRLFTVAGTITDNGLVAPEGYSLVKGTDETSGASYVDVVAVPEPSILSVLALSLLGGGRRRRRTRCG